MTVMMGLREAEEGSCFLGFLVIRQWTVASAHWPLGGSMRAAAARRDSLWKFRTRNGVTGAALPSSGCAALQLLYQTVLLPFLRCGVTVHLLSDSNSFSFCLLAKARSVEA